MQAKYVYYSAQGGQEFRPAILWANGPSSYNQTTGDPVYNPGASEYINFPNECMTQSGNYIVRFIPTSAGANQIRAGAPNASQSGWTARWSYSGLNGNITDGGNYLTLGPLSAASTNSAVASGVGTVTIANSLVPGQFVYLSLFTQMGALNGMIVKVASASATQFTFNLGSAANVTSGADTTGKFQVVQASATNPVKVANSSAAITNSLATTALLTMTCANTFSPGNFVYIDGLTNGAAANGVIVQVATASATQFTAIWTGSSFSTGADSGTATLLVTNGNAPIIADYTTNVTNSLATASSAGTAGVVTLTAANAFYPSSSIVVVKGLTNGAAVNGDLLVANASTTPLLLVANHPTAAFTTNTDAGSLSQLLTGGSTTSNEVPTGTNLSAEVIQFGAFVSDL